MNREEIIKLAREAGLLGPEDTAFDIIEYGIELWLFGESGVKALESFALNIINANQPQRLSTLAELIRNAQAAEREAIMDEWWMCVQSDLENGVKSLNERAAEKWRKEYPAMAGFDAAIRARGNSNELSTSK